MIVLDHAPYAPFMEPRTARPPGLSPLDMREWTVRLPDFEAQMAYRRRLLAERPDDVLGALPRGRGAGARAAREAARPSRRPAAPEPGGAVLRADRHRPAGRRGFLPAGARCRRRASTGWSRPCSASPRAGCSAEKLGRPLTPIHDPVPDYAGRAGGARQPRLRDAAARAAAGPRQLVGPSRRPSCSCRRARRRRPRPSAATRRPASTCAPSGRRWCACRARAPSPSASGPR